MSQEYVPTKKGNKMAVARKLFINKVDIGLKANKDFTKFYLNCKINGKAKQKVFIYENTSWDKRTRIAKAKIDSLDFKKKHLVNDIDIDENIKLDTFINQHFDTAERSRSYSKDHWLNVKKSHYERYIKKELGNKKVTSIRQMHIKSIISNLKALGLSARTQKQTIEILNPMFKSAVINRIITFNPCDGIVITRPKTKKKVSHASVQLKDIYNAIITVFKDDVFYQALYLFALQGRRKSEILTLKWEYIDFESMTYTLPNTKNSEEQTFMLPTNINILLQQFKSNKDNYVFESLKNPTQHIQNIKHQTNKLKKVLNNPSFGIHYLRNVVVSAMAEQGIDATYLSGALGHSDLNTMKQYLSMPYQKGSQVANDMIESIVLKEVLNEVK